MPLLILCLFLAFPTQILAWSGEITQVQSGDTLLIRQMGNEHSTVVRLYGIDAPSLRQPYGNEAKAYLERLLHLGRKVNVDVAETKADGVVTALVQAGGMSVNYQMIAEGLGWVQREGCKALFCRRWHIQERYAMRDKKGLWNTPHKTPPWQWAR